MLCAEKPTIKCATLPFVRALKYNLHLNPSALYQLPDDLISIIAMLAKTKPIFIY